MAGTPAWQCRSASTLGAFHLYTGQEGGPKEAVAVWEETLQAGLHVLFGGGGGAGGGGVGLYVMFLGLGLAVGGVGGDAPGRSLYHVLGGLGWYTYSGWVWF